MSESSVAQAPARCWPLSTTPLRTSTWTPNVTGDATERDQTPMSGNRGAEEVEDADARTRGSGSCVHLLLVDDGAGTLAATRTWPRPSESGLTKRATEAASEVGRKCPGRSVCVEPVGDVSGGRDASPAGGAEPPRKLHPHHDLSPARGCRQHDRARYRHVRLVPGHRSGTHLLRHRCPTLPRPLHLTRTWCRHAKRPVLSLTPRAELREAMSACGQPAAEVHALPVGHEPLVACTDEPAHDAAAPRGVGVAEDNKVTPAHPAIEAKRTLKLLVGFGAAASESGSAQVPTNVGSKPVAPGRTPNKLSTGAKTLLFGIIPPGPRARVLPTFYSTLGSVSPCMERGAAGSTGFA